MSAIRKTRTYWKTHALCYCGALQFGVYLLS
jgi:hypothetical protein